MNYKEIYPWQFGVWGRLSTARGRLPHAILLRGRSGIGKFDFSQSLANSLLCQTPNAQGYACGICASCGWFAQNNHPDYRLLSPEQESAGDDDSPVASKATKKSQISVAQIRELGSFLELSSHRNDGQRVVLIHPAEALNSNSANALLKMLEEPPKGVIFILVSHQSQRLLPTIMSRCHKVDMPLPGAEIAVDWLNQRGVKDAASRLAYAGGSPLSVLQDVQENSQLLSSMLQMLAQGAKLDVFALAQLYVKLGMESAIHSLQKWIYDLVAYRFASQIRYHTSYASALQVLAERVDLGLLIDFQRKLNEARRSALHPLNNELQLESLLLNYTQLFSIKPVR